MTFKPMFFRGKKVFVEVDASGQPVATNGRAVMKYNRDDSKTYNPSVANLSFDNPQGQLFSSESTPQKATPRKNTPKKKATIGDNTIVAYTDGGCIGNPGPSGLGYVVRFPDGTVVKKGEPLGEGTNNIAELTAIWRVAQLVEDKNAHLVIHTDSTYSIGVLSLGWKAKANTELIAKIKKDVMAFSNLQFVKVKGHAGVPDNELVDKLANGAARTQQAQN